MQQLINFNYCSTATTSETEATDSGEIDDEDTHYMLDIYSATKLRVCSYICIFQLFKLIADINVWYIRKVHSMFDHVATVIVRDIRAG